MFIVGKTRHLYTHTRLLYHNVSSFPLSKFQYFPDSNSPHMRVITASTCLTWRNFKRHKKLKCRRSFLRVKWAFSLIVLFYCIDPVHDRVLVNRRSLRHHRHLGSLDLHLHLEQRYIFGVWLSYDVGVLMFLFDSGGQLCFDLVICCRFFG